MTLLPTSGTLKGLRITGGTIVITDLDVTDQWINIALDVNGPVRDALETIDAKPLENQLPNSYLNLPRRMRTSKFKAAFSTGRCWDSRNLR